MSKRIILGVLVGLDILLVLVFLVKLANVSEELAWVYYERDTMKPDSMLKYLDWESYGAVASMSRAGRIGAKVKDEDRDLYLLGEYADMLYQGKIFEAKGDDEAAKRCAERCVDIRAAIPEYVTVLEKMDRSMENAIVTTEKME